MKVDYIALSIPVFFLLIGIELWIDLRKKLKLYRLNDSLTNISLGIGQQVTGIFMKTALFFGYLYLYDIFRFYTVQTSILSWILLFIGVDFFYYWFHRMSHEVNALWAAHIVHHQSEDYNLSVALRQSWFQSAFSWIFYLPLALIGFEPVMFLTISSFNTLYQFWIHTKTIGTMGPLEWVLNTPSHHRVHHGADPKYIDKNHGGTLIIWDRLFGTFYQEEEEPHYGITAPLKSWNPFWANFHYWIDLFSVARRAPGITNKLLVFIKPPGWLPDELGGFQPPKPINNEVYIKYNPTSNKSLSVYIFIQFVMMLLISVLVLFKQSDFTVLQLTVLAGYILAGLSVIGALFENKKWGGVTEWIRLTGTPILVFLFVSSPGFNSLFIAITVYALCSMIMFYFSSYYFKQEINSI